MADVTVTEVVEVVTVTESVVAVTVTDSGSPGTPGPAIELQTSATHIQWRVVGAASWINLVALADLEGPAGDDGTDGVDGDDGAAATISLGTVSTGAPGSSVIITEGGTANARIFNFTIPRGDAGTNGTNGIDGDDGREIEIQNSGTQIQWRYVGDVSWTNIVALSAIKGDTGAQGATEYVGNIDGGDAASTYGDLPSIDGGGAAG